jgi:hypothetical protein
MSFASLVENRTKRDRKYHERIRSHHQNKSIFSDAYASCSEEQKLSITPSLKDNDETREEEEKLRKDSVQLVFLQTQNARFQKKMQSLQHELQESRRKMAIQQEEHTFQKACWTDRMLDLHGTYDSKMMYQKRVSEQAANRLLSEELQELKAAIILHTNDTQSEEEESSSSSQIVCQPTQQQQFSIEDPLEILQQLQTSHTEKLNHLQEKHAQYQSQWDHDRTTLQEASQKQKEELQQATQRIKWLETELLTICSSDTDNDDQEEEQTKHPCIHVRQLLKEEEKGKLAHDRQIAELNSKIRILQSDAQMNESLYQRQIMEVTKQNVALQQTLKVSNKSLQQKSKQLKYYHHEYSHRIEELQLKLQNMQVTTNHRQNEYQHQLHLLRQSLDQKDQELQEAHRVQEVFLKNGKKQAVEESPTLSHNQEQLETCESLPENISTSKDDEVTDLKALVETLKTQVEEAKGREEGLEQQVEAKNDALREVWSQYEDMQQRMEMLLVYMEN